MTSASVVSRHDDPGSPRRERLTTLDVLRGVGLAGILVANVQLIAASGTAVDTAPLGAAQSWLGLPLFSLLFGAGFTLLADSASRRTPRPRLALLRRLLALLAFGILHMFLWPGDILRVYAVVGLLVLLPSTWLPRWAVAALAATVLPAALVVAGGGPLVIAGLFLTGAALARYGIPERIEGSAWGPLLWGAGFALGAVLATWADGATWADAAGAGPGRPSVLFLVADLLQTGAYACVVLFLLRTPLRPVLTAVFAPLGRMALTNYLTATLLVLVAARVVGLPVGGSVEVALWVAGAVIMLQIVFSALWLRRFRLGPVEWLWRWVTWLRRPALRGVAGSAVAREA